MKGLFNRNFTLPLIDFLNKIKLEVLEDELYKQLSSNLLLVPAVAVRFWDDDRDLTNNNESASDKINILLII